MSAKEIPFLPETGALDLDVLAAELDGAAALYLEMPSYLGVLDPQAYVIADLVHDRGAKLIVGADPVSLGVVAPPGSYGADLACGDLQPLGHHMSCRRHVGRFPGRRGSTSSSSPSCRRSTSSPCRPTRPGEHDYFWGNFEATSYETRGHATDFTGCSSALAGIVAATYLSLHRPGRHARPGRDDPASGATYAIGRLTEIPGLVASRFTAPGFKEWVVDFGPERALRRGGERRAPRAGNPRRRYRSARATRSSARRRSTA